MTSNGNQSHVGVSTMKALPSLNVGFEVAALSALTFVSLIFAPATQASVMVSNLSNSIALYDQVEYHVSTGAGQAVANDFTTGGTAMSLDSIRVNFDGGFDPSAVGLKVALYSDQGPLAPSGGPLSFLTDLTGASPVAGGLFSFSPTSPYVLAADTRYWAVFSALVPSSADELFPITNTLNPSESGIAGWSIGDHTALLALTNGTPNTGTWTYNATGAGMIMEVNASSAPEPSRMILLACGLGTMLMGRRRKGLK
jgi:hypothetical protein